MATPVERYWRAPGSTMRMSLFKNFALIERVKLQFRAEFFNLTNTPQFGIPTNRGLNTGGGFRPTVGASGNLIFPSQANIVQGPGAILGTGPSANRWS